MATCSMKNCSLPSTSWGTVLLRKKGEGDERMMQNACAPREKEWYTTSRTESAGTRVKRRAVSRTWFRVYELEGAFESCDDGSSTDLLLLLARLLHLLVLADCRRVRPS